MSKIKVFEFFGEIGVKTQQAEEGLRNVRDNAQESANGMAISFKKAAAVIGGALAALGAIDIGKKILGKGWDRLIGIDTATAKLTALGHSAQEVDVIMDNALQSVRGTAFGLESAATAAASAVAAGIEPGQELERYLSLVGDTAAIAGSGFEEMGSIFNKVMTSGVIQAEELNQLGDRGIPIFKMLADEMGVSQDQIRELASEGAISSEIFLAAIESGFGGAAKTMGELSLSAAIDNVWASVGRLGAAFLGAGEDGDGMFQQLKPLFGSVTSWIDSLAPKAEKLGAMFGNAFSGVIEGFQVLSSIVGMFRGTFNFEDFTALNHMGISSDTITSWQSYVEIITRIGYVFRNLFNMIKQPISNYLNRLKGHFDGLFDGIEGFDMQEMLVKVYQFLVQFQSVFQEAVDGVMDFMEPFFDYWERGVEALVNNIKGLGRVFQQIISGDFRGALNTFRTMMVDNIRNTGDALLTLWSGIWDNVKELASSIDWLGVAESIMSTLGSAISGAIGFLGDIGATIKSWISDKLGLGEDGSWSDIGSKIWSNIKAGVDSALTSAGNIAESIRKWISDKLDMPAESSWTDIAKKILDKISEGVSSATESITTFITNFINGLNNNEFEDNDLVVFAGKILAALAGAIGLATATLLTVASAIVKGISGGLDGVDDEDWSPAGKFILWGIKSSLEGIWDFADNVTDLITSFAEAIEGGDWEPVGSALRTMIASFINRSVFWGHEVIPTSGEPPASGDSGYSPEMIDLIENAEVNKSGWDWSNLFGGGDQGESGAVVASYEGMFTELEAQASSGMAKVNQAIRKSYDAIRTTFDQMKTGMTNLMTQIMESILTPISPGMAKVNQGFRQGYEPIRTTFEQMRDGLEKLMTEAITRVESAVNSNMTKVVTAFRSKISDITQAGRDTGRGFYDGLASQVDRIVRLANNIAQDVASTIRRALDTRSPSKVGFNIFRDFGQGLYNGLDSMRGALLGLGQDIALDTSGAVRDNLSSAAWNVDLKSHREDTSTILMTESFNQMNRKLDWLEQLYYKDTNTYMDSREVSRTLVEPLEEERRLLDLLNKRRKGAW